MCSPEIIGVVARFDDAATEKLCALRSAAGEMASYDGAEAWPPHMTFAAYENLEATKICQWAEEYTGQHRKFNIRFTSLGVFCDREKTRDTDIIYAVPSSPLSLISFYYGYHKKYDEYAGAFGLYYTRVQGQPALHATIAICKLAEFEDAFRQVYQNFSPFEATVTALEVYSMSTERLARYELTD